MFDARRLSSAIRGRWHRRIHGCPRRVSSSLSCEPCSLIPAGYLPYPLQRISQIRGPNVGALPWLFPRFPASCPFRVVHIHSLPGAELPWCISRISQIRGPNVGALPWLFPRFPASCPFRVVHIHSLPGAELPWCINTGKSLIPLTLRFLAQKRNLLIPLELSRVMHQGNVSVPSATP